MATKQKSKVTKRFDAGFWAGCYLMFWGVISQVFMAVFLLSYVRKNDTDVASNDLVHSFNSLVTTIVLMWGGYNLIRHGSATRMLVLSVCILGLTGSVLFSAYLIFGVFNYSIEISVMPKVGVAGVLAVCAIGSVALWLPIWLLLTEEAQREFG